MGSMVSKLWYCAMEMTLVVQTENRYAVEGDFIVRCLLCLMQLKVVNARELMDKKGCS